MSLNIGQVVNNRFEIRRLLGQGGFGAVYQAYDKNLKILVALKENRQQMPALAQLFEREAQLLASLSHPNLPKVTDHFTTPSGQYLVMDYIEGQTLRQILDQHGGPLNETQLLLWMDQICDALSYLHGQNPHIIHRDVKPDNIIVTAGGKAFLVDFGIAKSYHTQHNPTTTIQAGTAHYAPPEQLGPGRTDARTDVYALGATMYHLLTGHYPPTSGHLIAQTEQLKPLRDYNSRVSRKTERAILKAMDLAAPRRYQTMADFRRALPLAHRNGAAAGDWWTYLSRAEVLLSLGGSLLAILFFVASYWGNFDDGFWSPPELVEGEVASTGSATATASPPEPVEGEPTNTPIPATNTSIPPTNTSIPPTNTPIPPTNTPIPPTNTPVPPTNTPRPTNTPVPPTNTPIPPTDTPIPPTFTPVPPTNTPIPLTNTPRPPTNTPAPTANRQASSDNMVRVPAGEFTMGSDADVGFAECEAFYNDCKREWFEDEEPEHTVYVDEFYIDKYEVTNEQYRACVEAGDCDVPSNTTAYNGGGKGNHPVVYVNWQMSRDYCEWAGKRLPTEAEWEKAARGTDGRVYPWGNEFDGSKVNFCDENCSRDWKLTRYDDGYAETSPVGSYELGKSPYGAYDMAGNVWEWTLSAYESYPYDKDDGRNDTNKNVSRVLRGGSWFNASDSVRTANRLRYDPTDTGNDLGFRCLRSP